MPRCSPATRASPPSGVCPSTRRSPPRRIAASPSSRSRRRAPPPARSWRWRPRSRRGSRRPRRELRVCLVVTSTPKFCSACGGRLAVVREEGRTRRRCRRCGFTVYGNPVPTAVALIMRGGRVLLTRRARPPYAGTWDVPGGFLEAGEHPEACLRRELREELGMRVRQARLLDFALDRYGPKGFPLLTLVYRVTPAQIGRASCRERVECAGVGVSISRTR